MHRAIAGLMSLLLGAGAASAADFRNIAKAPVFSAGPNWTGFYLRRQRRWRLDQPQHGLRLGGGPVFATVDNNLSGVSPACQAGYNWQSGSVVFGVEADFQASGMKGGLVAPCPPGFCAGLAASFDPEHALVRHGARPHRLCFRRLADLRHRRLRLYAAGDRTPPPARAAWPSISAATKARAAGPPAAASR